MSEPAAIRLRGWGWRHGDRSAWAVRGVDLDISAGERVLLLGPSGAGKSTLLAAMSGALEHLSGGESEGTISVRTARGDAVRAGVVLQDPDTQVVMSRCGDDVAFGPENYGIDPDLIWSSVESALATVGFPYSRDRSTDALSGGERQRLTLAGALAVQPGLLLLDEPTANLDPAGATLVRAAIHQVAATGDATLVLVDHRVAQVLDLVERVIVLEPGGGIVVDGPPARVFAEHSATLAAAGVWVPGRDVPQLLAVDPPGGVLVRADSLSYRYPNADSDAVSDVELGVHAGEIVAVTGGNGSGKSTVAGLLAGLRAPTAGRVLATPELAGDASGTAMHRWPARDLVDRIGTVFQNPEHQFLTGRVEDELMLGLARVRRGPAQARTRVAELLDRLRLRHLTDANPFTLSGGEKRRLSVATALATEPPLLILDEPTFGQDYRTWHEMVRLIADLRNSGSSMVVVTHDEDVVHAVADRVVTMARGRLVA